KPSRFAASEAFRHSNYRIVRYDRVFRDDDDPVPNVVVRPFAFLYAVLVVDDTPAPDTHVPVHDYTFQVRLVANPRPFRPHFFTDVLLVPVEIGGAHDDRVFDRRVVADVRPNADDRV